MMNASTEIAVDAIPTELVGSDREAVARMIVEVARKIGAELSWSKLRAGWTAVTVLAECKVAVLPDRKGARIESERLDHDSYYETADKLAATLRSRSYRYAKRIADDKARFAERARREAAGTRLRASTREVLIATYGADLVKAAIEIKIHWPENATEPEARVNVYVSRKISGEQLTVDEAHRFITVMMAGGYTLQLTQEVR